MIHMQLKLLKEWSISTARNFLDSVRKSTTDAIKTNSKRSIQKNEEATGDLIGNEIANKITSVSKSPKELHSKELHSQNDEARNEIEIPKERYLSPDNKLLMN